MSACTDPHRLYIGDAGSDHAFITSSDTGYDVAVLRIERASIPAAQQLTPAEWQALIDKINTALMLP